MYSLTVPESKNLKLRYGLLPKVLGEIRPASSRLWWRLAFLGQGPALQPLSWPPLCLLYLENARDREMAQLVKIFALDLQNACVKARRW